MKVKKETIIKYLDGSLVKIIVTLSICDTDKTCEYLTEIETPSEDMESWIPQIPDNGVYATKGTIHAAKAELWQSIKPEL